MRLSDAEPVCRGKKRGARRGMAVVVVLLMVAAALAASYAIMRSQSTAVRIHANANRQAAARQAALTGLAMALKHMQTTDWAGVDSTLSRSLGPYESFTATYTAGDASLAPSDPDYAEYPYRVTLLSTGFAQTPGETSRVASYRVGAVVRLVPRGLSDHPTDWNGMQSYTVYQTNKNDVTIDIPCRFEGKVRFQKRLRVAEHYPNDGDAWERYLKDLNQMRLSGYSDYRPFDGPVRLPYWEQDSEDRWALTVALDLSVDWADGRDVGSDWVKPESLTTYRLYQGGPVYTIPTVGTTLQNTVLEPDPLANPLGIRYAPENLSIDGNVTIRGSLIAKGEVKINGLAVVFEPVALPALEGTVVPVRLPAVSCNKFFVKPAAGGSLTGLLAVFDEFQVEKSPDTVTYALVGRLISRKLGILERQPWDTVNWHDRYAEFIYQLYRPSPVPYFPVWMGDRGYNPAPRLTVKADPAAVTYHWHNWYDPVYVPGDDDDGLRWELIAWTENP